MTLGPEQIEELVQRYEKESRAIKSEALKMTWYMRGGITYDQAMQLSYDERKVINDIIKDNLDTVKKTGLPLL